MKNKLLSLAGLLAAFNLNAIEIGPTGSGVEMSGFLDIQSMKQGDDTETTGAQVELNFNYATGPVSAAVGLDFGEISVYGQDADNANLEEAYVTYDFGNGFSVTGTKVGTCPLQLLHDCTLQTIRFRTTPVPATPKCMTETSFAQQFTSSCRLQQFTTTPSLTMPVTEFE